MIRYIHIGNQIAIDDEEPADEFAFYCTVRCEFIEIGVGQVWSTVRELRGDHALDVREHRDPPSIERLIGLIPSGKHGKPVEEKGNE